MPSPNVDERPAEVAIDLVVLHSISLPPGEYGGPAVEQLFTNHLDPDSHPAFGSLAGLRVSAHFVIARDGAVVQYAAVPARAWHAGVSSWRGRTRCNDFSVGIELEGLEGTSFDERQYPVLARLVLALAARWPIAEVVGHEHVAPGRKGDPGAGFDWMRLAAALRPRGPRVPPLAPAAG